SISFCMTVFSRSSCSRAATPADERARTRCTSMYAIRIDDAGAAAPGDAGCWAPTGLATTTRSPTTRESTPRQRLNRSLLDRPALLDPARVDRRNAPEFEGADRVRAAQVKALEQRHLLATPAGLVAGLAPHPQDVAEPERLEIGLEEVRLVEVGIAPEAGEVEGEGGLPPLGRGCDHVPAVAGQGGADRGGDRRAFLLHQIGRCGVAEVANE